jgi:hypothetical protein
MESQQDQSAPSGALPSGALMDRMIAFPAIDGTRRVRPQVAVGRGGARSSPYP